ncbi:MAG: hypothetical protein WDZ93_04175 [Candidatus Paceibacterota bacterium]
METVLAFMATILFGPAAFFVFTRISTKSTAFPSSVTGLVGDTVFLPLFNALAVYYGLVQILDSQKGLLWTSILLTTLFIILYFIYRKKVREKGSWMYGEKGSFNFAGWYHLGYVGIQSFVVTFSLLHFYTHIWLWLILFGYAATATQFRGALKSWRL